MMTIPSFVNLFMLAWWSFASWLLITANQYVRERLSPALHESTAYASTSYRLTNDDDDENVELYARNVSSSVSHEELPMISGLSSTQKRAKKTAYPR